MSDLASDSSNAEGLSELRACLFDAIRAVRSGAITTQQGKTIGDLAQVMVNSAKVEVDYLEINSGGESAFIDSAVGDSNLPPGVTRHRLK